MKLLIDSEMVERIRTGGTWYVENLENLPPARFLDLDSIPVKTLLEMWQDDTTAFGTDVVRYSDLTDRVVQGIGREELNDVFNNAREEWVESDKPDLQFYIIDQILDRLKGVK